MIVISCTVAAVLGSIYHGNEVGHHRLVPNKPTQHTESLTLKSATIIKGHHHPTAVHEGAHYDHEHGDHNNHEDHNCYQRYQFGYKILDKYGNKQAREEEADEYNSRKGYYSFIDHNGLQRKVEYVADKHGFRATVITNEPGTAKQHSANVNMLANPLKIAHKTTGHTIGQAAHGEHYRIHTELDPRGHADALVQATEPHLKKAVVVASVAVSKEPVISAPIAPPGPVGVVKSTAYAQPLSVISLPKLTSNSRGHTYESRQPLGYAQHYALAHIPHGPVDHAHGYALVPTKQVPSSGYLAVVEHMSRGLEPQASFVRPIAYAVPYSVRMALVTGKHPGKR